MSSFIDVSGLTYCGKEAQDIFSKDIYELPLYGNITFMDGVKGKVKLYNGEIGDVWQEYSCPFSPDGEVVLSEDFMEPAAIKVNLEECYDKFWNTFLVEQTEISLHGGIPQTFADWFFAKLRRKMATEYQEIFWKGDEDYSGTTKAFLKVTDGVEKQLDDKVPSGNTIAGSVFTVSNIIAQVEAAVMKAIEVAAAADTDSEPFKIMMNHNDVRLLEVALGKDCTCNNSGQIFNNYARNNGRIWVMGFEVIETVQSRNTIIVGNPKNLVLGYDTFDSHLEYRLIDLRETTGDNMFRIIAVSIIAVGVIYPELFVVSKP